MARAVDVSVVTLPGLILDVGNVNGDAALTLLGSLVDVLEGGVVGLAALGLREDLGDGRGRGGLAVVDVTNRTDVYVGLRTIELLLGHCHPPFGTNLFGHPVVLTRSYGKRRRSAAKNSGTGDWTRTSDIAGMSRVL